jgi:hypothetical protein
MLGRAAAAVGVCKRFAFPTLFTLIRKAFFSLLLKALFLRA